MLDNLMNRLHNVEKHNLDSSFTNKDLDTLDLRTNWSLKLSNNIIEADPILYSGGNFFIYAPFNEESVWCVLPSSVIFPFIWDLCLWKVKNNYVMFQL
jgi:hypothetical protein